MVLLFLPFPFPFASFFFSRPFSSVPLASLCGGSEVREREIGRSGQKDLQKKHTSPSPLSLLYIRFFPSFFFRIAFKIIFSEGKRGPKIRGQRRGPDISLTLFLNFSANKCFFLGEPMKISHGTSIFSSKSIFLLCPLFRN